MTRQLLLALVLAVSLLDSAAAFSCQQSIPGVGKNAKKTLNFDLGPLGGERTAFKKTETPPTTSEAKVRLNLCDSNGLKQDSSLPEEDQCGSGTKLCLTMLNHKSSSNEASRVTAVIPVWTNDVPDSDVQVTSLPNDEGLEINVAGATYAGSKQNLLFKLYCSPAATDPNPSLLSYGDNTLTLEWSTPDACHKDRSTDGDEPPAGDGGDSSGDGSNGEGEKKRSGGGFFGFVKTVFWLAVVGLIAYFAIGIYYNYTTYGAKGLDLLPHKEFWTDLPGMIKDLASHLASGLRGRGSASGGNRAGYTSL